MVVGSRPVTRWGETHLKKFSPPLDKSVRHSLKTWAPSQKTLCLPWCPKLVSGLVGRGQEFENFSQSAVFLVSSSKKQISPLLAPLEKILEKSTSGPSWKKSFRRPCTQACKITPFL